MLLFEILQWAVRAVWAAVTLVAAAVTVFFFSLCQNKTKKKKKGKKLCVERRSVWFF